MKTTGRSTRSDIIKKLPALPCLEIHIQHSGKDHALLKNNYTLICRYKDKDGNITELDVEQCNKKYNTEVTENDFTYKYQGSNVTIKGSTISAYRKQNNYYGPLKVVQNVKSEMSVNKFSKTNFSADLEPFDVAVTQNGDRSVNDQEINLYTSQIPGFISAFQPPTRTHSDEEFTIFRKGSKKYVVPNSILQFFREQTNCEKNFDLKIEEIFHSADEKIGLVPVTIITLFEKKKGFRVSKSKKKKIILRKRRHILKAKKEENLKHAYLSKYSNWALRGNLYFTEMKRVSITFIDELLVELPVTDDLEEFSESSSSASVQYPDKDRQNISHPVKGIFLESSKEHACDIWKYLIKLVKQNHKLTSFEYEIEKEKWIEIKRTFNVFQIDEESMIDIILKVVLREVDNAICVAYYVRCLNRFIKHGILSSVSDVNFILKIFAENKYVCIGFDKDKYIYQCDENEVLRQYLKENGQLSMFPFESIRNKKCKGIVIDSINVGNFKFERGKVTIYGPPIVCQQCEKLLDKLEELFDPSLSILISKQGLQKTRQRYGPIRRNHLSQNIKKMCLETPYEFISHSKNVGNCEKLMFEMEGITKKLKVFDSDLLKDDKPIMKVSELEFDKMLSVSNSQGSEKLTKSCNECGFQAPTMLSLFLHMSSHIGTLTEKCNMCSIKLANKEAVKEHIMECHYKENLSCTVCQESFSSKYNLFVHMNCHRACQPYVCIYCDQKHQTLDLYMKHMRHSHHMETEAEMNFSCKMCCANFVTYDHLLIHRINSFHTNKAPLKCKICNFTCVLVSAFQTHLLSHTYDQRECHNLAMCQECKTAFFSSFELEDHLKEHKNIIVKHKEIILSVDQEIHAENEKKIAKTFTCEKCNKIYGTGKALHKHSVACTASKLNDNHASSSTEFYSFSCNHCGMKFTSEYFLTTHMSSHSSSGQPAFQNEDPTFSPGYNKQSQSMEHITHNNDVKVIEKNQLLNQQVHQQTHGTSYNHLFRQSQPQQQEIPFTSSLVSGIASQSHIIQAHSDSGWNQQQNSSTHEEAHDSVYSLLHL